MQKRRQSLKTPKWTQEELATIARMKREGKTNAQIAKAVGRTVDATRVKAWQVKDPVPVSKQPLLDKPLHSQGDAVILSDVEAPYQHSEFINNVLELARAWNIPTLHLAGDLLHYSNLSAWGSEWTQETESLAETVLDFVQSLKGKAKEDGVKMLEESGLLNKGGLSEELKEARKVFKAFDQFTDIYVELGNHDDRYIRALEKAVSPDELLHQLDVHNDNRWHIAQYYYAIVETERGEFRITHPRGAGRTTAQDLAVQYHQHIIMGHSHRWAVNRDPSGKYWAIQTGACVDERRLAYVMQRDAKRDAHLLGATIIRNGYPFVLCPESPWEFLKGM